MGIAGDQTSEEPRLQKDPTIMQGRIVISPLSEAVVLEPGAPRFTDRDSGAFPIEVRGEIRVRVESILPSWGATVEALELRGPGGVIPADRLLVRMGGEKADFLPLSGRVRLITGDHHSPVEEVPLEILFCPTWHDRPGQYVGRLRLRPAVWTSLTTSEELKDEELSEFREQQLGDAREIEVKFESPQVINVVLSSEELHFDATAGAGTIPADEEISIGVSTNASIWRVECQATPLMSDEHEIPASRILWERVDDFGTVLASGNLADQPVVFKGHESARGALATLHFKIHIFTHDIAAVYDGALSMIGIISKKYEEEEKIRSIEPHP